MGAPTMQLRYQIDIPIDSYVKDTRCRTSRPQLSRKESWYVELHSNKDGSFYGPEV